MGCRQVLPKRSLIRVVRSPNGVIIDPSGKAKGRGAYVHDRRACWIRALEGNLARALKCEISGDERHMLEAFVQSLAEEEPDGQPHESQSSGDGF